MKTLTPAAASILRETTTGGSIENSPTITRRNTLHEIMPQLYQTHPHLSCAPKTGAGDKFHKIWQKLCAIMKSSPNSELVSAIRAVAKGKRAISEEVKRFLEEDPPAKALTPRQMQILEGLVRGLTNQDIATEPGIREDRINCNRTCADSSRSRGRTSRASRRPRRSSSRCKACRVEARSPSRDRPRSGTRAT